MAHILRDRVMETASTTGTGDFTLAGAYTGYRAFSSVCSTNDTFRYCIAAVDANGNDSGSWEVGLGTYSAANTLTRTTVEASSNANAAVNFAAGSKRVFMGASATWLSDRVRPIPLFFTTTPQASEILAIYMVVEAMTLAANFAGAATYVGTNPGSSFVLTVKKNGSSVGTVTISTLGVFTLATSGGTAVSLAAGDRLTLEGPAVADASVANVGLTLKGAL